MIPPFDELLDNLIDEAVRDYTLDDIISALELKLMALKEQEALAGDDE